MLKLNLRLRISIALFAKTTSGIKACGFGYRFEICFVIWLAKRDEAEQGSGAQCDSQLSAEVSGAPHNIESGAR